jgi:hypothetical protein
MKKLDLENIAQDYMKRNGVELVMLTEDGNIFTNKNAANAHRNGVGGEVHEFKAPEAAPEAKQDAAPEAKQDAAPKTKSSKKGGK